ncbi:MAG: alpha/beta fold hydrolase [Actinomycetota bacterium]
MTSFGERSLTPLEAPGSAVLERASHVHDDTNTKVEVDFFEGASGRIFGLTHLPFGAPLGALLICSPFHAEFQKNYRQEVLLARALAQSGIAVQRFHYRGSGHSDGHSDDVTFDSMCEDAVAATEWLTKKTGVADIAFMGTRWGGLVAAAAASERTAAPVALWEPTMDAKRYFREVFRARAIGNLAQDAGPADGPMSELEDKGSLDVLGYSITKRLYDSAAGRTLVANLGERPRPLLLIQIGRSAELRGEYKRVVAAWEQSGLAVDTHVVAGEKGWWFPEDLAKTSKATSASTLMEVTTEWLAEHAVRREAAR